MWLDVSGSFELCFGWLKLKLVFFRRFLLFFVFVCGGCYGAVCLSGFSGW